MHVLLSVVEHHVAKNNVNDGDEIAVPDQIPATILQKTMEVIDYFAKQHQAFMQVMH